MHSKVYLLTHSKGHFQKVLWQLLKILQIFQAYKAHIFFIIVFQILIPSLMTFLKNGVILCSVSHSFLL